MITGSIVALVTPMTSDGSVDWPALERLLDMHMSAGTGAIGAVGTTGESATLSVPEHCAVIRHCVEYVAGRIPIMAGTGANATREAIELTREAANIGADCCLLVTPYYNRPSQRGLYEHFKAVAEAVDIPQILYNVPGRTAVDMSNDTVDRLANLANIVGIKDATGDLARGKDLVARCGDRIAIFSGDDPTAMELMLAGGKGNISVTANVAPAAMAELCAQAMAGDRAAASAINERLMPLNRALFLTWLDQQYHADVAAALEAAGV